MLNVIPNAGFRYNLDDATLCLSMPSYADSAGQRRRVGTVTDDKPGWLDETQKERWGERVRWHAARAQSSSVSTRFSGGQGCQSRDKRERYTTAAARARPSPQRRRRTGRKVAISTTFGNQPRPAATAGSPRYSFP